MPSARVMVAVVCALAIIEIGHALQHYRSFTHSAVVIAGITLLCGVQLFCFRRLNWQRFPVGHLVLTVQIVLVFAPIFLVDHPWVAVPGFLAGSALLVLPPVAGWAAYAVTVAIAGALHADPAFSLVTTAMTGLIVYGLPWLEKLSKRLEASRAELAKHAVADERLRVSRDLHDLLGYGISAITLKSELAHRLLPDHPDQAREAVGEVLDIARHTLVDVRSVALGYRLLSIEETFSSAKAVLAAAEVDVRIDVDHVPVPEPAATVLATVVREGVTNVLRHSKAENCEITVRQQGRLVVLDIINDGATDHPADRSGSGVRNMTERVHEIGGVFTARHVGADRFHLHASIPLEAT